MADITIRVDRGTHRELERLADQRDATVAETVAWAVRVLRQERMGEELTGSLARSEREWLDASLG